MSYTLHTNKTWQQVYQDISDEFRKWNIAQWDVNTPRGALGMKKVPMADDNLVVITYVKDEKNIVLKMNTQKRAVDNFRVLFLAIEAMRLNEKRGIADTVAKAYLQLGAPSTFDPYQILGLQKGLPISVYEAQYKELAKKNHTDLGGSPEKMKEINEAIAAIRKENA